MNLHVMTTMSAALRQHMCARWLLNVDCMYLVRWRASTVNSSGYSNVQRKGNDIEKFIGIRKEKSTR